MLTKIPVILLTACLASTAIGRTYNRGKRPFTGIDYGHGGKGYMINKRVESNTVCRDGGQKYKGNCYYLEKDAKTRDDAMDACLTENYRMLTTPVDEDEQNFMLRLAKGKVSGSLWLDLTWDGHNYSSKVLPNGRYSWSNWKEGKKPHWRHCVVLNAQTTEWEHSFCKEASHPFICSTKLHYQYYEAEQDCNSICKNGACVPEMGAPICKCNEGWSGNDCRIPGEKAVREEVDKLWSCYDWLDQGLDLAQTITFVEKYFYDIEGRIESFTPDEFEDSFKSIDKDNSGTVEKEEMVTFFVS